MLGSGFRASADPFSGFGAWAWGSSVQGCFILYRKSSRLLFQVAGFEVWSFGGSSLPETANKLCLSLKTKP